MNEHSLKRTAPCAEIIDVINLTGYRRVFDLASSGRISETSGKRACVLNLEKNIEFTTTGTLIKVSEEEFNHIDAREAYYDAKEVNLENDIRAQTFIAHNYDPYPYLFDDPTQEHYLELCIEAAKKYSFLDNFLDTTFIENKSLREYGF